MKKSTSPPKGLLIVFLVFLNYFAIFEIYGQKTGRRRSFAPPASSTASPSALPTRISVLTPQEMLSKIHTAATVHRLPPRLFESLVRQESAGRLHAVSYKGAACLTQLMPDTARRLGLRVDSQIDERFNIDKCLDAGARYLRFQLDLFGDVRLALAGYNAGEGAVLKFGRRIPPYRETTEYVEKICFFAYGQRGHSVAMAYNQLFAAKIADAVYGTRFFRVSHPLQMQEVPLPIAPQVDQSTAQNAAGDGTAVGNKIEAGSADEKKDDKPVPKTKVELPARIRGAGLYFSVN